MNDRSRSWTPALAALAMAVALAGCSATAERKAAAGGGGSVRITPDPVVVTSQIAVVVDASFADPAQCTYRWRRNDQPIAGALGQVLDPGQFRKGDELGVEVTLPAREGAPARTLNAVVRVANSPPVVREARFVVDRSTGGVTLQAIADVVDPDGDPTTLTYRWLRNGKPIEDAGGPSLSVGSFSRGDVVTLEAVAFDGESPSAPRRSEEQALDNRAPSFSAQPTSLPAVEGTFRFQAVAADPDGDPVQYELVQGPSGMTVTSAGAIDWTVPAREARQPEYPVTIRATDSRGGEATQQFTIRLTTSSGKS